MEGIPTLPTYLEWRAHALTPANPLKDKKFPYPNSTLQFPRIFFFAKRNSSSDHPEGIKQIIAEPYSK
jgi:hypothetical protein